MTIVIIFTRFNRSHFEYLDTDNIANIIQQNYVKTRKQNAHKLLVADVRFISEKYTRGNARVREYNLNDTAHGGEHALSYV